MRSSLLACLLVLSTVTVEAKPAKKVRGGALVVQDARGKFVGNVVGL